MTSQRVPGEGDGPLTRPTSNYDMARYDRQCGPWTVSKTLSVAERPTISRAAMCVSTRGAPRARWGLGRGTTMTRVEGPRLGGWIADRA
jgi:hypothetical protein